MQVGHVTFCSRERSHNGLAAKTTLDVQVPLVCATSIVDANLASASRDKHPPCDNTRRIFSEIGKRNHKTFLAPLSAWEVMPTPVPSIGWMRCPGPAAAPVDVPISTAVFASLSRI
jgi:hypothetical protein